MRQVVLQLKSPYRDGTTHIVMSAQEFAAVRVDSDQRKALERLCGYITRPAIANERRSRNAKDQVVLQLKSPCRDGTTHIVMWALEFMQHLAALVPRPRPHLIRFHGVLAPHAKLRAAIVPGMDEEFGPSSITLKDR